LLSLIHVIEWRAAVTPDTGVTVTGQLPRNATGKVVKSTLREPFWAGQERRVS
jgi:hypothetical protein